MKRIEVYGGMKILDKIFYHNTILTSLSDMNTMAFSF